ncbi:MAG TPA: heme ABC transporter ATP-binding protein [Symbiobacteriaceae bacterium]|nr:heme ABC transporter ATP-binding protein [Symbiobacteriaceae bacterium]
MSPLQTSGSAVLEASDVCFRVDGRLLVDGVGLSLRPGRLVGLVGPNGAGKSTLLRLLGGLLPASSGSVLLGGEPIGRLSPEAVARRVARVPQSPSADLDFTVLEVVLMGRYAHGAAWQERPADRALALAALHQTRTDHLRDRLHSTLSGGERQRVAVARALAQEPGVLLLDEATASLDLRHQFEVMEVVRHLTLERQMAAVAAIHDLSLAARYCDELLLLHGGRAVAAGEPADVLTPERLRTVFGVDAVVERHPALGHLLVLVRGI